MFQMEEKIKPKNTDQHYLSLHRPANWRAKKSKHWYRHVMGKNNSLVHLEEPGPTSGPLGNTSKPGS